MLRLMLPRIVRRTRQLQVTQRVQTTNFLPRMFTVLAIVGENASDSERESREHKCSRT